jgi:NADH-quinone oxidoreductase subunit L
VRPYLLLCRLLGRDPIDRGMGLLATLAQAGHRATSRTQTGQLRWYALSLVGGAVLLLGLVLI